MVINFTDVKVAGVTRVRNEAEIFEDTLNHFTAICSGGIYVLDEASTDNTADIAAKHPAVKNVIRIKKFETDPARRAKFEGWGRQRPLNRARQDNPDWNLYFDADERIEFDYLGFDYGKYDVVAMKLFDFYITPEDVGKGWKCRRWIGPEYRWILMMFRDHPAIVFNNRNATIPAKLSYRYAREGYVKHYGKAISVKEWEDTCDYYINYKDGFFKSKWLARKGKAIHDGYSDFGGKLITWKEKERYGTKLKDP